ncbi:MAG: endopeptidase La [Lachnospiraceae bacterium]|nr:endopeptidase La [Lachnospiraceae bacterium]MBQ4241423.1 endopeptidase La [Lachnospiraceae bacterium]
MAVLPIYNILALPDCNIYFKVDFYTKHVGREPQVDDRVTLIVLKENITKDDFDNDSFYPVGLSGIVTEVNTNGYFIVHTRARVNIDEVTVYHDKSIDINISKRPDTDDADREALAKKIKELKSSMSKYAENFQWAAATRAYIAQWTSLAEIATAMSPWIINSNEERYAILAEDSLAKRNEMLEKLIYENLEMTRIDNEAKSAQEADYQKIYRESAIKKQMEYLQRELDEMHPEEVSDIRRLEIRLNESEMNETARKEASKLLNRLKQEGQSSQESGMLLDYLDFLIGLPWKKQKFRKISLDDARKILDRDHYGLAKTKKRIIEQIAVMNLRKQQSGSIICFVGAPGTGKTSIASSIAKALKREYIRVSLGGVRDEADIRGHRRTYIGAMSGRIMDGISKAGVSNPVMVLDEIDKLSASYNGDPAAALLEVLDPEQNNTFTDHYLNVPYDLSDVLFICTANSLDSIPEPLLNRMEVIQFNGYTPIEKYHIARKHLIPKAMKEVGIRSRNLDISDEALNDMISNYTREAGVRGLKKRIDTLCRSVAVKIVEGNGKSLKVGAGDLRELLDMTPIPHDIVDRQTAPGVVTGLAWTQAGGEILFIETILTKGKGRLIITGQLGDVMKESAQIALSLVKSMYPSKAEIFDKNDLHIHVPDGATPKDGPSAGITLTTALASLVTERPVDPRICMTGEVSLEGKVKPIGGLPEKLMAAHRAGCTKAFIPEDNEGDLKDVANEVREALDIVTVSNVRDVLKQAGIGSPRKRPAVKKR